MTVTLTKGWNVGGVYTLSDVTTNSFSISGGYGGGSGTYAANTITFLNTHVATKQAQGFLSSTTTTTTTTTRAASSCTIPGVADLVTPELEEFLSRAVVKRGEPQVDLASPANNQENVQRIMRVLPSSEFEFLFPRANKGRGPGEGGPYSYLNFLKSAWQFPYFCNEPGQTDTNCKQELVAMFAQFAQEVGEQNPNLEIPVWRQGLYHYEELCAPTCIYRDTCDDSSWQATKWPCPAGLSYHGRGAKQLTHNYNYGPFSTAMFGDSAILLNDPDRIIRDGWLAFSSAFWFYMTPQPPKPSMHDVVTGRWQPNSHDSAAGRLPGFGVLIMIINGAQECSNGPMQWATNRINFFKDFSNHFSLPIGAHLDCETMPPFDNDGAAMYNMYWAPSARGGCELQEFVSPCNLYDTPYDFAESYCQCSACGGVPPVVCPPPEPLVSCSNCGSCVANQCHEHGATDAQCAPCANGGQSWWPCDVEGLCTCAD